VSGNCYLALNATTNFWNASSYLCKANYASMLELDDDNEVKALLGLLKKGIYLKYPDVLKELQQYWFKMSNKRIIRVHNNSTISDTCFRSLCFRSNLTL
jgi:hypothetical protein